VPVSPEANQELETLRLQTASASNHKYILVFTYWYFHTLFPLYCVKNWNRSYGYALNFCLIQRKKPKWK